LLLPFDLSVADSTVDVGFFETMCVVGKIIVVGVGSCVGAVGTAVVGSSVGSAVGLEVGSMVGSVVGVNVGTVGDAVGAEDGE